jgi:YbbR domain-containing protein
MNWLLNNFWLKIVAFGLGFLVWIHVATNQTYNHEMTLPVTEISLDDGLALTEPPPDSVRAEVSATGKQLLRRKWRQEGLRIDAGSHRAGRYTLSLTTENTSLAHPSTEVTLREIMSPRSMRLEIDAEASSEVPVVSRLEAVPDEGFAIGQSFSVVPVTVTVIGPRTRLRMIDTVYTAPHRLSSLRNPVTITLPIAPPSGYGFRVEPETVSVSVAVFPAKTRVFEGVPIQVFNSPAGTRPRTTPPLVRVELTGPPEDIDRLDNNALTLSVDFREMTADHRAAVKFDCPPVFRFKSLSVDSVTIIDSPNANPGN